MIDLKHITLTQKEQTIFSNFSLHIKAQERLVILGGSGSGKTTLLRLIAGFITPDEGEIYLNDTLVTKAHKIITPAHQRNISMLFQDLALWPHLDVQGNIEFALKIHNIDRSTRAQKVKEMLALVQMQGYEKRHIETLSGGQQQRIALARSLALSPQILLMDEPLSSLDATLNQALRKHIVQLQEKLGFTLVYVTHNQEEAKEIATRVLELK